MIPKMGAYSCSPPPTALVFHFPHLLKRGFADGGNEKPPLDSGGEQECGERGIRTLDTLLEYTHFPGVLLQPLGHLSLEIGRTKLQKRSANSGSGALKYLGE